MLCIAGVGDGDTALAMQLLVNRITPDINGVNLAADFQFMI
jgi:hypothetical protein